MLRTLIPQFFRRWLEPEELDEPPIGRPATSPLDSVQSVSQRYPSVRNLAFSLSVKSPDNDMEPTLHGRSFGPDAKAYFRFKCKNVECVNGGFDLSTEIDDMIAQRRRETSGRRVCQGWENASLVNQRRCLYELNFKAVASYHE